MVKKNVNFHLPLIFKGPIDNGKNEFNPFANGCAPASTHVLPSSTLAWASNMKLPGTAVMRQLHTRQDVRIQSLLHVYVRVGFLVGRSRSRNALSKSFFIDT